MKRFSRGARYQRGATLTGYALLMSGIVVVSLGAIEAVNQSSQTVLGETAVSVGTPRPGVEQTKTADVGSPPPWVGSRGPGSCSAGLDGCPLGEQLPFSPSANQPTQTPIANYLLPPVDLDQQRDPLTPFVVQESMVRLNGEWIPPDGDFAFETPVTLQPGDVVCSFMIHARSDGVNSGDYISDFTFQGEILGTAYDTDSSDNRNDTSELFGHPDINLPNNAKLTGSDSFTYSGNTLSVDFGTNSSGRDGVRVFTRC